MVDSSQRIYAGHPQGKPRPCWYKFCGWWSSKLWVVSTLYQFRRRRWNNLLDKRKYTVCLEIYKGWWLRTNSSHKSSTSTTFCLCPYKTFVFWGWSVISMGIQWSCWHFSSRPVNTEKGGVAQSASWRCLCSPAPLIYLSARQEISNSWLLQKPCERAVNGLRKQFAFSNLPLANWFPGHMAKGKTKINDAFI